MGKGPIPEGSCGESLRGRVWGDGVWDPPEVVCEVWDAPKGLCVMEGLGGSPPRWGEPLRGWLCRGILSPGAASAEESCGQLGFVTSSPKTEGLAEVWPSLPGGLGVSPGMAAQLRGSLAIPCSLHTWGSQGYSRGTLAVHQDDPQARALLPCTLIFFFFFFLIYN